MSYLPFFTHAAAPATRGDDPHLAGRRAQIEYVRECQWLQAQPRPRVLDEIYWREYRATAKAVGGADDATRARMRRGAASINALADALHAAADGRRLTLSALLARGPAK